MQEAFPSPAAAQPSSQHGPDGLSRRRLLRAAGEGCAESRARLVMSLHPLAARMAASHARPGLCRDELEQDACVRLIECIDAYDPAAGVPLEAWAAIRIGHALRDSAAAQRAQASGVTISRSAQRRALSRGEALPSRAGLDGLDGPAERCAHAAAERRQMRAEVLAAVGRLPACQRHAAALRFWADVPAPPGPLARALSSLSADRSLQAWAA